MWRIRILLVLTLLVVATLPASAPAPPKPSSKPEPVPAPWAEGALQWFEARDEAARLGIPNLLRFVAPDVVYDGSFTAGVAVGLAEYGTQMRMEIGLTVDEPAVSTVYLDVAGALVAHGRSPWSFDDLTAFEIDEHGMMTHESEMMSASYGYFVDDPAFVAVRALAEAYLRAWSASDADAVRPLYSAEAALVDSLQRLELTGRDAIGRHARSPVSYGPSLLAPDNAVFLRWSYGSRIRPDDLTVFLTYTRDDATGCAGQAAAVLQVSGGLIVLERRYHEIESVRRCWDAGRLPDGWWTGLRPPAPYEDVVTGTVRVAGQRIEIHNGTAALDRLVRWAIERFEAAGLPPPSVESVTFDEDVHAPQCSVDRTGLTVDRGGSAQLFLCIAQDDACEGDECTTFVARARLLVLHELAHAWMLRHVDESTQQSFMEHMGLEEWSSAEVDWHDRGVEQAAQIVAWGLMDEPIRLVRLDRPCEQVLESFRLLTGGEPRWGGCSELD